MGANWRDGCKVEAQTPLISSSTAKCSQWDERHESYYSWLLSFFHSRLACGDELSSLIKHIRSRIRHMHPLAVGESSMTSVDHQPSAYAPQGITDDKSGKQQSSSWNTEEGHAVKRSCSNDAPLHQLAKAALLFSVESDGAREEVTRLVCEPALATVTQSIHKSSLSDLLPLPPKIDFMLSDKVAVSSARRWAGEGRWQDAMRLLASVQVSHMSLATALEVLSRTRCWDIALRHLGEIPTSKWTEVEIGAVLRTIYKASRYRATHVMEDEGSRSSYRGAPSPAWWGLALSLLALTCLNGVRMSTPSPINDSLALLTGSGDQWQIACRIVNCFMISNTREMDGTRKNTTNDENLFASSYGAVPPNVVTVYHLCRVLQKRWYMALRYASLMIQRGSVRITDDRETTQRLLHLCVRGNRWFEATWTVQQCLSRTGLDIVPKGHDSISADTFLHFLEMLNKCQKGSLASQLLCQRQLSKHFSTDVSAKAFNVMLRNTTSTAESNSWLQVMKAKDVVVENESYEHLLLLFAREGEWVQALTSLHRLLNDPMRRRLYVPPAKVHDAVQYALERTPPPGASWEVSVRLFSQMCELHVPISEVAFQSAVKKCFSQGMVEQAQAIFTYMIRYGVRK
uniref:Uncharacterized protein TCIL3000_11_15630 n=1 Tax=Trypanosoma congolense (strain IL3000) TaxID=1068625 RepID=G0V330_TRYCI|nr:unnamed protein product [Trypanosoma congolense IL3000]